MMWILFGVSVAFVVASIGSGIALSCYRGSDLAEKAGRCALIGFCVGIVLADLMLVNVLINGAFPGGLLDFGLTLLGLKLATVLLVVSIEPAVRSLAARVPAI